MFRPQHRDYLFCIKISLSSFIYFKSTINLLKQFLKFISSKHWNAYKEQLTKKNHNNQVEKSQNFKLSSQERLIQTLVFCTVDLWANANKRRNPMNNIQANKNTNEIEIRIHTNAFAQSLSCERHSLIETHNERNFFFACVCFFFSLLLLLFTRRKKTRMFSDQDFFFWAIK